MENNLFCSEATKPVSGVRWKQTTASLLFVLNCVFVILSNFLLPLFLNPIGNSEYDYVTQMSIVSFTSPLLMLCVFLLLRPLSVNRIVRMTILVLVIAYGLLLAVRVLGFLIFSPDSFDSFIARNAISSFAQITLFFLATFSFTCILKNCAQLLGPARVWVQIILCSFMVNVTNFVYNFMIGVIPQGVEITQVFFGTFYGIFDALVCILLAVSYYKFAKSGLFSGVFDDSPVPAGSYSIVNKYWAAVLVIIVLFGVTMYFVLSNADKLLNLLN